MKKTQKKYTFQIYETVSTDWSDEKKYLGTYSSVAPTEAKAISNIWFREKLRNHADGNYYVKYTYKLISIEEESMIEKEPEDNWPKDEDGDPLPLRKRENGIDYILTDNGEYTEVYD